MKIKKISYIPLILSISLNAWADSTIDKKNEDPSPSSVKNKPTYSPQIGKAITDFITKHNSKIISEKPISNSLGNPSDFIEATIMLPNGDKSTAFILHGYFTEGMFFKLKDINGKFDNSLQTLLKNNKIEIVEQGNIPYADGKKGAISYFIVRNPKSNDLTSLFFSNGVAVMGNLLTLKGESVTQPRIDILAPKPSANSIVSKVINNPEKYLIINDGNRGKELYVFVEPMCGACRMLHDELTPLIDKGEFKVHYIPITFRRNLDKSTALIVNIASSQNPTQSLRKNYEKLGEIITKKAPSYNKNNPFYDKIKHNTNLFRESKVHATPSIFIKIDGNWKSIVGALRKHDLEELSKK